jgi:hypothetical protein
MNVTLTDDERSAIEDALLDDRDRSDGYRVLGPGGTDGNTPTVFEAVESIIAKRLEAQRSWYGGPR